MKPAVPQFVLAVVMIATSVVLRAQSPAAAPATDLDAFMSRVLERRDDNWKKFQQFVLEERQTIRVRGPHATLLYGMELISAWFPRDGVFIKSPLRINGAEISEADRRRAEEAYVKRYVKGEEPPTKGVTVGVGPDGAYVKKESDTPLTAEGVRQALEPGFVSAAYFMKFKFDPGQYALAGRETFEGRDVYRVEYYPTKMFSEGRTRPNKEVRKRSDDRGKEIERQMNKVALVTLWIDRTEHQILKYDFSNIDMDFLPARWMVHMDGLSAAMEMGQPFPSVWLPRSVRIGFDLTLANGQFDGRYAVDYYDYKLATVATKVR
jgi:hypothetical protein